MKLQVELITDGVFFVLQPMYLSDSCVTGCLGSDNNPLTGTPKIGGMPVSQLSFNKPIKYFSIHDCSDI